MNKMIVWCRGKRFQRLLDYGLLSKDCIKFIVDSDVKKQGTWRGMEVVDPQRLYDMDLAQETILITTDRDSVILEIRAWVKRNCALGRVLTYDEYISDVLGFGKERTKLLSYIREAGTIRQSSLERTKVYASRNDALECVPKGGIAAEIGVAYGNFSEIIIQRVQPDLFLAIDYFSQDNPYRCFMGRTDFMDAHKTHQEWYEEKFAETIKKGKMKVLQGWSWDVLGKLPDDYLDFAYLDACHNYDAVNKDISVLVSKVKDGGIIAFNDYVCVNICTSPLSYGSYYGVVPVANRLINQTSSEVLGIGMRSDLVNDIFVRLHK